jgi:drug/metabolite transporter (DMT)-like permease
METTTLIQAQLNGVHEMFHVCAEDLTEAEWTTCTLASAIASVLALALGETTLAYICFYWLIDHVGPTRIVVVTYLLPCMALVYGALLLHEAVRINALGGLLFILLGIFLIGRKTPAQAPAHDHVVQSTPGQTTLEERTIS